MERAFHLPALETLRTRQITLGSLPLMVADLSAEQMRPMLAGLRARAVRGEPAERAAYVAAAARGFLDPAERWRRRALDALPALTGFSPAMIEETLPRVFGPLADAAALERAVSAAGSVVGVLGIVAAGNIPGIALLKTALALTAGAACVVKTATGEPLLTVLFAQALAAVDPSLASALAVSWWEGGSGSGEEALVRGVDSLVAYGSDASIAALAARRSGPFVGFGHKVSVALVRLDRQNDIRPLAMAAAVDVALYDQLGCLSPQALFVIGAERSHRREFVDRLAEALDEAEARWPRGALGEAETVAIRRVRDDYEWRELSGADVSVRTGQGWTILEDQTPGFRTSPLHRTIFVRPLEEIGDLRIALGEWLPRVECVGMGPWPDAETGRSLAALGIPRVAALGRMQDPGLDWRQGGMDPMAGIISAGQT